jgi:hypothetical protein
VCPRSGRGTFLQEAARECLGLIGVDEVLSAVAATAKAGERE